MSQETVTKVDIGREVGTILNKLGYAHGMITRMTVVAHDEEFRSAVVILDVAQTDENGRKVVIDDRLQVEKITIPVSIITKEK
jgi:FixJ family two-component response regulator